MIIQAVFAIALTLLGVIARDDLGASYSDK